MYAKQTKKRNTLISAAFLSPAMVLYLGFVILPIAMSIYYSLTKWSGAGMPEFIGLRNFQRIFKNKDYWICFGNTVQCILFSLALQLPLGLIFAYLLSRTKMFYRLFRSIYFLPAVISPTAIGTMFLIFLNGDFGPFNLMLKNLGLHGLTRNWLSDSGTVLYAVMFPMIWQYIGHYIIIFLAGIQSIPEDILESARMDGANSFQIFFKIVIPMLKNLIGVCVVLCFTGSVKAFDQAYVMTGGGPGVKSSYLAIRMYERAFTDNKLGEGTAIAITMLVFSLLFTIVFNKINRSEGLEY